METPTSSSFPGNRLNTYLQLLTKVKKGLPYGQPVCVSVSHTINTTDAVLELASLIGPHIAILQVHADIIDDWSHETARQLICIANRHAFLIWEGGRILNATVDIIGRQKAETRDARSELVDLTRKVYSKGLVRPAAWAGLATAWPSGVPVNNQEADILIPTLRNAAREAVAETVKTIRTEITTERPLSGEEATIVEIDAGSPHLGSDYVVDDSSAELAPRKPSTISLTQTITQHTEDVPGNHQGSSKYERPYNIQESAEPCTIPSTGEDLPTPPLHSRGLVLCLPSVTDTSFTADYRRSCIAAADANLDFVLGFVCSEPWQATSQKTEIFDDISLDDDEDQLSDEEEMPCLALFSIISNQFDMMNGKHVDQLYSEGDEEGSEYLPVASPSQLEPANSVAKKIFYIVKEALKSRAQASGYKTTNTYTSTKVMRGRKVLHLPIIAIP
ncbi:hypothetical protein P170DRAFT_455691 [Aspergillus steynii IBT 23096]|uniref:Uncharacterized protein n=1 Tax=Aspergillus steynii IBT 23096 TaxID=1392250 RepID=A0A2I2G7L5_9EURO|nr:uncharacterized protein P170DRAFT_455691 [Aspergillus steynii IBT 23096]PLB48870.1 hypothetical protein P170DRAFT_455691 [Aspergillus steynii IBT 23096]